MSIKPHIIIYRSIPCCISSKTSRIYNPKLATISFDQNKFSRSKRLLLSRKNYKYTTKLSFEGSLYVHADSGMIWALVSKIPTLRRIKLKIDDNFTSAPECSSIVRGLFQSASRLKHIHAEFEEDGLLQNVLLKYLPLLKSLEEIYIKTHFLSGQLNLFLKDIAKKVVKGLEHVFGAKSHHNNWPLLKYKVLHLLVPLVEEDEEFYLKDLVGTLSLFHANEKKRSMPVGIQKLNVELNIVCEDEDQLIKIETIKEALSKVLHLEYLAFNWGHNSKYSDFLKSIENKDSVRALNLSLIEDDDESDGENRKGNKTNRFLAFRSLQSLSIYCPDIKNLEFLEKTMECIGNLCNLKHLYIEFSSEMEIENSILKSLSISISNLSNLESLYFNYGKMSAFPECTNEGLNLLLLAIGKLTNLTSLELYINLSERFGEERRLVPLGRYSKELGIVHISDEVVMSQIIKTIQGLHKLEKLQFSMLGSTHVKSKFVKDLLLIVSKLRWLVHLTISTGCSVPDKEFINWLENVFNGMKGLRYLELSLERELFGNFIKIEQLLEELTSRISRRTETQILLCLTKYRY